MIDSDEIKATVPGLIQAELGAAAVSIEGIRLMTGGASRQIWAFDAIATNGDAATVRLPLVLRSEPVGGVVTDAQTPEFELLQAAHDAGVPVPRPHFEGRTAAGARFFVMDRVEGETLARRLLRDETYARARAVMPAQLGATVARIHRIDHRRYELQDLPRPGRAQSPAEAEIARYEDIFRSSAPEPHPAFELALRWLKARAPRTNELTLVHGDFRIGNMVFGDDGLRAVLDWELAHLGDPMEDLGWICVRSWRFGGPQPVGGIGSREEFFHAYEDAGGFAVDRDRVRFWEAFGSLRWGIICINQAQAHLQGRTRSVELAAIGRRTVETEWELLRLMEEDRAG
ncbi:MAG: phosphotransferase [Dehalococcoidia bacterium]|nr:phosphotransferase [Dehalococcoidia bacterium]